jgi:hypothetical protein
MPPKKDNPPSPTDTLPSTTLIPNSALLRRFLTRLPKTVIVDLVLIWLDHPLCPIHQPLDDEDDDFYGQEDETLDDKRTLYEVYRDDTSITKKVVIDRILGIDWVNPRLVGLITETRIKCPSSCDVGYATPFPSSHSAEMAFLRTQLCECTT